MKHERVATCMCMSWHIVLWRTFQIITCGWLGCQASWHPVDAMAAACTVSAGWAVMGKAPESSNSGLDDPEQIDCWYLARTFFRVAAVGSAVLPLPSCRLDRVVGFCTARSYIDPRRIHMAHVRHFANAPVRRKIVAANPYYGGSWKLP